MLIGYITELLGNESWEDLITSRVLEPLGMTSSKVLLSSTDVLEDNVAKPYIMPGDQLKDGHYDIYKYLNKHTNTNFIV
jgi:CubicO group peptidase (beta-lactamase class C family)